MVNDEVVKCPLCGGFTQIANKELLEALKNTHVRQGIEDYIAKLLKSSLNDDLNSGGAAQSGRDFQKEVHSWNPCVPTWRRSPKE